MLANNNQVAINRIYHRMLKENKVRNRIAIIAIILTTFMFTAVFTLGFSIAKNLNQMQLRFQGTRSSIYLEHPREGQLDEIKGCKALVAAGVQIDAQSVADLSGEYNFLLQYYDSIEFKENVGPAISNVEGKYPELENEIMLSDHALDILGIAEPKLGQNITLYENGEGIQFVLSGWFTNYNRVNTCLVSKAYIDKQGYNLNKNGRISISAKEGKQLELKDELDSKIKLYDGQELKTSYDVQSENNGNRIVIAISIFLIALMIVLSGYLLIYNVMYISVTKDIRFYGMLKTIGASPSQIRLIVKRQAVHLACIGIPIGILLGTGVSFGIVPIAMNMLSVDRDSALSTAVNFNPFIYVFSIIFGFATVFISSRKPAWYAGKVSAIDAMKYIGNKGGKSHKTTSGGKLSKMAWRNVFREKKRSFLVFASMFMGSITFLCVNTFIDCLDVDSFIEHYIHNDYVLYGGSEEDEEKQTVTMMDIAQKMSEIDGMGPVYANREARVFLPFDVDLYRPFIEEEDNPDGTIEFYSKTDKKENSYSAPLIAVDSSMIKMYNKTARQKIDIKAFEAGEVCLMGYLDTIEHSEQMLGKNITLLNYDTKKEYVIKVGAAMLRGEDEALMAGYYWSLGGAPEAILVSNKVMDDMFPDADVNCIMADAKKGREADVTPYVERIVKENAIIYGSDIRSVESVQFKKSMLSLEVLGGGISMILILIGIVNYINVMITGVYTRRMELAVLESVGMTKKQIRKMLMYEGMIYGMITVALIATLGSLMMYGTGQLCLKIADYAIFHYPIVTLICVAVVLFAICVVIPSYVFKSIAKDTVTERLRMVA